MPWPVFRFFTGLSSSGSSKSDELNAGGSWTKALLSMSLGEVGRRLTGSVNENGRRRDGMEEDEEWRLMEE
jgi:hypothetical protein